METGPAAQPSRLVIRLRCTARRVSSSRLQCRAAHQRNRHSHSARCAPPRYFLSGCRSGHALDSHRAGSRRPGRAQRRIAAHKPALRRKRDRSNGVSSGVSYPAVRRNPCLLSPGSTRHATRPHVRPPRRIARDRSFAGGSQAYSVIPFPP
jgi:hypothetical protein